MLANFDGLLWLLILLGPLLILVRHLQRETQAVFLLLTRRSEVALVLFSLVFFPGVLLHEVSHFVVARLLGVRTGRFSLAPQPLKDGRLQLGFVETASTDVIRDALIGLAPLLTGGLFVSYVGLVRLGLPLLWDSILRADPATLWAVLSNLHLLPDFWLWFYLTFAVSSTMLPSDSDRRAWLPIGLAVLVLVVVSIVAGAGPWLLTNFAPYFNQALRALAAVFGITIAINMVVWLPMLVLRRLLSRLTGLQVV